MKLPDVTPTVKWKYDGSGEVESSVVVGHSMVFSAAGKTIFALDRATGRRAWSFEAGAQVLASGALGGGAFLVGTDDRNFYALEQDTGKLLWKFKAGEFTGGATVGEEEGVVYVGSGDNKLHAYFLNGTRRFTFPATGQVCSTPALDETGIYFGDDGGMFYKLSRTTGQKTWEVRFPSGIRAPARLEPDGVFLSIGDPDGSKSGEIVRLNYDGSVQWRSDCDGKKRKCYSCWTSPAVVNDVVVVGCGLDQRSTGYIWGLGKEDGAVRWKIKAGNDCQTSSPVVVGDAVILGCIDGTLYAVNAADGVLRWKFTAGKGIWTTPALDTDGTIYIGSHDGFIYALGSAGKEDL